MEETRNRIKIYTNSGEVVTYEGNCFVYHEDSVKRGCVHFKDANGKHHRVYNATVIIDEM